MGREQMSASAPNNLTSSRNAVELVAGYGEWFVRIVQDDKKEIRAFDVEAFAKPMKASGFALA
jgi:hypothetical protein